MPFSDRNVDDVHNLMDDVAEQQEIANEISDAISNPVGFQQDVDEVSISFWMIVTSPSGAVAKYSDEYVCLSARMFAELHMRSLPAAFSEAQRASIYFTQRPILRFFAP